MNTFRAIALSLALLMGVAPAAAQWQVPNHAVPIGQGAGVTGFANTPPGAAGQVLGSNGAAAHPSFQSPSSVFDNAYCNTIGYLIVRFTGAWTCDNSIPGSVKWWGATGNGSTDDTAAVQATLNAMQAIGGNAYFPSGCYKVNALTNTAHIRLSGAGYAGDSGGGFAGHGVTSCTPGTGSVIVCAANINCYTAITNQSVQIENLQFSTLSAPTPGTATIRIQAVAGAGNANTQTIIRGVMITGGDTGLDLENCLNFNVTDSHILYQITYGMVVNAPNFPSFQQASISGNMFWGAGNAGYNAHILAQAGGDLRIVNNKMSTGGVNTSSISLFGQASGSQNMEPMVIAGNSSEGADNCLAISSANASFTVSFIVVTGNQFWCGHKAILINGNGTLQYVLGMTVTGNVLAVNGAAGANVVNIDGVSSATFVGNAYGCAFGGCSAATALSIGVHSLNVTSQGNTYDPLYATHVQDNAPGAGNSIWDSPLGAVAAVSMGASPATVTASSRPQTHYVRQAGTQDGSCSVNGQVVALLTNTATYYPIRLNPNESYVCTYTTTTPTITKDIQ